MKKNNLFNKNAPNKDNFEYFVAIADLLYYSIKNQNEKIAKTISEFLYSAFKEFRAKSQNEAVVYPSIFYDVVSKTIEELAFQKNKRLSFLEQRTAGSIWLLGEFEYAKISEETYSCIWSNLNLALKYDKDDYIIFHWEHAHQHLSYALNDINYYEVKNEQEIEEKIKQRKRFLEFHYALGGLLLYKRRYNCLKRAFTFTNSIPPRYELLPESMDEVFNLFFDFYDPYDLKYTWISNKYYFPELGGLNADGVIKNKICQYIALLFVRQYSIVPYLITMKPLDLPQIPKTQGEKKIWINNLDYFKQLVENTLNNDELLKETNLNFVNNEWCEKNDFTKPIQFIENLKQKVIDSYDGEEVEQRVSESKVLKFKNTTAEILKPVFDEYKVISNKSELLGDLKTFYIYGQSIVSDKSGFAEDQEAEHINFDSFLAENLSNKYKLAFSEIFFQVISKSYLLNFEDIIPAIIRLGIDIKDYVIVSFGIEIDRSEFVNRNSSLTLNDIEFVKFNHRNYNLVGDSLFILKKDDLPRIIYTELEVDEIEKYSLSQIDKSYELYATVIDLNKSIALRERLSQSNINKDLRKSVYISINFKHEVQWKKNIQCIQIKQASVYRERGIVDKINDIKSINEKP